MSLLITMILITAGIVLVYMVIHFSLNPEEWEKVKADAELEAQRRQRRKKVPRRITEADVCGPPWHKNRMRRKLREQQENDKLDRYFRKFE